MPNPRPYQHTTVGMQINLIGKQYSKAIPFAKNKHSHRLMHHHSSNMCQAIRRVNHSHIRSRRQ